MRLHPIRRAPVRRAPIHVATIGAAVTTAAALLAGCTTGGTTGTDTSSPGAVTPPVSTAPVGPSSPAALPTMTPPHVVVTTPPTPSVPGSAGASPTDTTGATVGGGCTDLTIRVLPGGATPGREIAAITFVNNAGTACALSGYPAVVLGLKGSELVTATPTPHTVAKPVQLAANGGQASALITDISTCNAPLSDTITVTAPNGSAGGSLSRPFRLRGCTVHVDPVKAGS